MLSGKTINCLLVAVVLVGMVTLPIGVIADEWKPSKEFRAVSSRITDLGKITNLSTAKKQKRLEELETLGREIEQRWRQTDVGTYARLTYKVCATLGSLDFGTRKNHHLAQAFAMRALEKADKFPLEVECKMLGYVQQNVNAEGKPLKGKAWAVLRKKQANLWLHAWQRVEKTIDKDWNPKDTGVRNVSPPNATGLPSGVAPTAIKDPKLRAEYEAAIEANRQKIKRYNQQYRARKLKKRWIPGAERFIIWAYMESPTGKAELKELEGLLKKYVPDAGKRARILNAVEKKKIPDGLILRNTTQPAKPKLTTKPAQKANTLRLEVVVSLDRVPLTLILRATNQGKNPVSVPTMLHSIGNHLIIASPDGKIFENIWTGRPKLEMIQPGRAREWTCAIGKDSPLFQKPGLYRVRWRVGKQISQEILLLRERKPLTTTKPEERGIEGQIP